MSILFDDASSQYLSNANAVTSSISCTLAAWFNTNDDTLTQVILSCGNSGNSSLLALLYAGAVAGDRLRATYTVTTGGSANASSGTVTTNAWQHGAAVFSGGQQTAYLNGSGVTNVIVPFGAISNNQTFIGRRANTGVVNYFSGMIAEAAIWSVALTSADVQQLYKGFSPKLVRPESLLAYWPLLDQATPSIDHRGGFDMTWNASPIVGSTHPAMFGG